MHVLIVYDQFWKPMEKNYRYNGWYNLKKLESKVSVVTGGSSRIGLATAKRFATEGSHVYITGRRQKELDEAVKHIGRNVTAVKGDVSNLSDLDQLYSTVRQQHDRVDILFANAGIAEFGPLGQISEAHFDKTFNINVKVHFLPFRKHYHLCLMALR